MTNTTARVMKMMSITTLSCAALACVGCDSGNITEKDFKPITLAEVRGTMEGKDAAKTLLVDTRLPSKFEAGHIPGASNLDLSDAKARTGNTLNPELAKYKTLIVYGEDPSSPSARAMTTRLMVLNHDGVRIFEGGWSEWVRAGLPSEKKLAAKAPENQGTAPAQK